MRRISTRFSLVLGGCALAFSVFLLYYTWSTNKDHMEALAAREGDLALEFDLAVRQYVSETVRPMVEQRGGFDEFCPELMSSSFVARSVFDKVEKRLPDYVIKFSSDAPRNPANQAGPEEMELLEFFRRNPNTDRWSGRLQLEGREFYVHASPMRMSQYCLQCHGRPEDAPRGLVERYGREVGFHRKVGDVVSMDLVGVPMARLDAQLRSAASTHLLLTGLWVALLFSLVAIVFHGMVGRRLAALAEHFRYVEQESVSDIPAFADQGHDEIGVLAASFNALADKLRAFHASLEDKIAARTAELSAEVAERKRAQEQLQEEQRTLRQLLDAYEGHRQMISYEIHDAIAQPLTGALMNFEAAMRLLDAPGREKSLDKCNVVGRLLQETIREVRRLMRDLRPTILDDFGVVAAVDHLVKEVEKEHGVEIEWSHDVRFDRLAIPLETAVYRVIQEGLANALRHSGSKRIRIRLIQDGNQLRIAVEDWGKGFDPQQANPERFGLRGIRERARLFGGRAAIESAPGEGTHIDVVLPVVERQSEPDAT